MHTSDPRALPPGRTSSGCYLIRVYREHNLFLEKENFQHKSDISLFGILPYFTLRMTKLSFSTCRVGQSKPIDLSYSSLRTQILG